MNVTERAERQGVASVTARRWFAAGKLPVPVYRVGGLILVGEPVPPTEVGSIVGYARDVVGGPEAGP